MNEWELRMLKQQLFLLGHHFTYFYQFFFRLLEYVWNNGTTSWWLYHTQYTHLTHWNCCTHSSFIVEKNFMYVNLTFHHPSPITHHSYLIIVCMRTLDTIIILLCWYWLLLCSLSTSAHLYVCIYLCPHLWVDERYLVFFVSLFVTL